MTATTRSDGNGGAAAELINGESGNDTVNGGDDNDTITGGDGDDTLIVVDGRRSGMRRRRRLRMPWSPLSAQLGANGENLTVTANKTTSR